MLSVVVVKYTLASGIFGWTNPIVLQRWNIHANHTGEIHKRYTVPIRHIELDFPFIAHVQTYFYFKDFLILFTIFKINDYVICTCSMLFYLKKTVLQYNEKC